MKRLIAQSLDMLSTVLVVVILVRGLIGGYQMGGAVGALIGLVAAFLMSVLVFGALFTLLDMAESLRTMRGLIEQQRRT
jgi:chromate transport protein ChrA